MPIPLCPPLAWAPAAGGAANCTDPFGNRKGPEPRLGPRPSIDGLVVCALLALLAFGSLLGLPGAALARLRYSLPVTEHRVDKFHVGIHRRLAE